MVILFCFCSVCFLYFQGHLHFSYARRIGFLRRLRQFCWCTYHFLILFYFIFYSWNKNSTLASEVFLVLFVIAKTTFWSLTCTQCHQIANITINHKKVWRLLKKQSYKAYKTHLSQAEHIVHMLQIATRKD